MTLYVLATQGVGPFTADRHNTEAVLAQVRAGEVLPLRVLAPDIPRALEHIILRAMDHRPENRYANAAALADDLEEFVRQPATDRSRPAPKPGTHASDAGASRAVRSHAGAWERVGDYFPCNDAKYSNFTHISFFSAPDLIAFPSIAA